ncbi:MAG TPA: hypothetical protein VJ844_06575 [Mucilaginibacter sp.]|nr:hypothetical protein [Mucilaginibacter sp.]
MISYNMEIKNTGPILSDLLTAVHSFNAEKHVYISSGISGEKSASRSSLSAFGIKESPLPGVLNILGIRSLTLNSIHDLDVLSRLNVAAPTAMEKHVWDFFKDDEVIRELKSLFSNCRTIAFDDWATISGASVLWDGLLTDVIKPLGKTDLEFIFYLGDPMKKLSFEVDEALDIISTFSLHGKVTFALDENEAVNLWMKLNGVQPGTEIAEQSSSDLKKKYFSIFRTISVAQLLIYSADDAILYSDNQQFVLSRKKVDHNIEIASDARQNFIAGYSIGSLMRLDIGHCIALGLIVFGCHGELQSEPERKDLYSYIQSWIRDLQKPEDIQLYQD